MQASSVFVTSSVSSSVLAVVGVGGGRLMRQRRPGSALKVLASRLAGSQIEDRYLEYVMGGWCARNCTNDSGK